MKGASNTQYVADDTIDTNARQSESHGELDTDEDTSDDEMDVEFIGSEKCESVLVSTGVYSQQRDHASQNPKIFLSHAHRDFIMDPELRKPTLMAHNVYDAVQAIFQKEGIR